MPAFRLLGVEGREVLKPHLFLSRTLGMGLLRFLDLPWLPVNIPLGLWSLPTAPL